MKTNYLTNVDPINYDDIASNSSRHLRYYDYKHLKNVDWGIDTEPLSSKILSLLGLVIGYASILTIIYFIGV